MSCAESEIHEEAEVEVEERTLSPEPSIVDLTRLDLTRLDSIQFDSVSFIGTTVNKHNITKA